MTNDVEHLFVYSFCNECVSVLILGPFFMELFFNCILKVLYMYWINVIYVI